MMTRQEAINLLRGLEQSLDGYCELNEDGKKAFGMAIDALGSDNNVGSKGDMISRAAAITLANSLKDDLPDDERIADTVMAHNEGVLEYQTALSLLPSAQPETTHMVGGSIKDSLFLYCEECGEPVHSEYNYCPRCGRKFEVI